jgi:hypothetical protein
MSTRTTAHPRADDILRVLARQEELGRHLSEAEIGRELEMEGTEIANVLRGLSTSNEVMRTASGNWELTAAAREAVTPRPDPKEPGD